MIGQVIALKSAGLWSGRSQLPNHVKHFVELLECLSFSSGSLPCSPHEVALVQFSNHHILSAARRNDVFWISEWLLWQHYSTSLITRVCPHELRGTLSSFLPPFMIVGVFVFTQKCPCLPRTCKFRAVKVKRLSWVGFVWNSPKSNLKKKCSRDQRSSI